MVRAAAIGTAIALLLAAHDAPAQSVWVKDELNLHLRTGAGNTFRIISGIKTGDRVEILSRTEGWTEVRTESGKTGWVPAGFLQAEPPATIAFAELEREATALRSELERLTEQSSSLQTSNQELSDRDAEQRSKIDQLTRENYELRAGARWPEWITGAGIVFVGMILGWILSRSSGRRRQQRIRL